MQPYGNTATAAADVHCQRTAAIAKLIAHHLFLPSEEKELLFDACLLHHRNTGLFSPKCMKRLLADIFGETEVTPFVDDPIPAMVRRVLNAFDVPGSGTSLEARLADILRLADAFDLSMEAQPIYGEEVGEILERCGTVWRPACGPENQSMRWCRQLVRPSWVKRNPGACRFSHRPPCVR